MSLTPEREAEIRAVLNGELSVDLDYALPVVSMAADDLLAEVDRLRAGIEGLRDHMGSPWPWRSGDHPTLEWLDDHSQKIRELARPDRRRSDDQPDP